MPVHDTFVGSRIQPAVAVGARNQLVHSAKPQNAADSRRARDSYISSGGAPDYVSTAQANWAAAGIKFAGTWKPVEFARLNRVLNALTPPERARLRGIEIVRGNDDPELSGNYQNAYASGRITYYDTAFNVKRLRSAYARENPDWVLFHEIGHAIMYGADHQAAVIANAERDKYIQLSEQLKTVAPSSRVTLLDDIKMARQASDLAEAQVDTGSNSMQFASKMGSHKAVSAYGATQSDEAFAEAFAMYKTQPHALEALDPDLFNFFERGDHVTDWAAGPGGNFTARTASDG